MEGDAERLPAWVTWQHRPFPDANLLLLGGRPPALVDSGFVGHAQGTAAWTRARTGHVAPWSSTPTGTLTTSAAMRSCRPRAPGSRPAPQTPRPLPDTNPAAAKPSTSTSRSAPSTIDEPLHDGQILGLGDADWQVLRTPGHTPGHLSR